MFTCASARATNVLQTIWPYFSSQAAWRRHSAALGMLRRAARVLHAKQDSASGLAPVRTQSGLRLRLMTPARSSLWQDRLEAIRSSSRPGQNWSFRGCEHLRHRSSHYHSITGALQAVKIFHLTCSHATRRKSFILCLGCCRQLTFATALLISAPLFCPSWCGTANCGAAVARPVLPYNVPRWDALQTGGAGLIQNKAVAVSAQSFPGCEGLIGSVNAHDG